MKKVIIILILTFLIILSASYIYFPYFSYNKIPLSTIEDNPTPYNKIKISIRGLVIRNEGAFFGPQYELAEFESSKDFNINAAKQIALGLKSDSNVDLSNFISYTFDGRNYTQIANKPVNVKGIVIYHGPVTDAPQYYLDLEKIKLG